MSDKKKCIIDLDNAFPMALSDIDDAISLAVALATADCEVMGLTACAGNCRTYESAANTLRQLDMAGREDIPVALGREEPFLTDVSAHFAYLDKKSGKEGWDLWEEFPATTSPRLSLSPLRAHELIIQLVKEHPGIGFVAQGSLTNLALALLAAPEIVGDIGPVIHMGGVYEDPNFRWSTPDIPDEIWETTLRFNTLFDPHASAVVFKNVPVTVVPANVTTRLLLREDDIAPLGNSPSPYAQYLYEGALPWICWSRKERELVGAHMHDPMALLVLLRPELFSYENMHVDLLRLYAGDGCFLSPAADGPQVRVVTECDCLVLEKILANAMRRIGKQTGELND